MKLTQKRRKASKLASQDFISNMPDNVVTTMLDRLPLQDAVRTGILSRDWRSKWTNMLSQLVFDQEFYDYVDDKNYEEIISTLLLHLKGPITKFVLFLEDDSHDITHCILPLVLSRKEVKDVTIIFWNGCSHKLPRHFYSCLEFKHLNLDNCYINPPPGFHGFPNLLSLKLHDVEFKSENFLELVNDYPALESLNMGYTYFPVVKLVEFAKLINLKSLTFFLCNIDETMITSTASIFELVSCLPNLEELELDFVDCKPLIEDEALKGSPTTFLCLKTLKLSNIDLGSGIMLSLAFEMIKSSPSLQTLEITAEKCSFIEDWATKRPPTTFPYLKTIKFSNLGSGSMLLFAFDIIKCSPNLQTLEITVGDLSSTEDCATKRSPTIFPYLKTIKFLNLGGGFMLSSAIDIIRSSPNLQTLEIKAGDWSSIEDGTRKRFPTTLPCLKTLTLSNIDLGNRFMVSFAFKIMKSSQNLQTLEITAGDWCSAEDGARNRSRITFPSLKTLKLYDIDLGSCIMLSLAFEIVGSSPNLQTLEITAGNWHVDPQLAVCYPKIDCNKMGLMRLQSVVLTDLRASMNELSLIKYLLACSPFLKKVVIRPHSIVKSEDKFMFARKLLKHRASTTAEIKFY